MTHRTIDYHIDGINSVDLDQLGRDLHAAYETVRRNPSRPDGFPSSASGADTGGGGNGEWTSVERAGNRALAHPTADAYDKIVYNAIGYLRDADHALRAARNKLDQLGRLQDDTSIKAPDSGCWVLARIGSWEAPTYTLTVDGEVRKVGSWAYRFHRANGRIPNVDECKRHARGEKIYVKAS